MFEKVKRNIKKIQLDRKQKKINEQFNKYGLTDDILKRQVEVNTQRNELDIPDDSEKIYEDFVQ